MAHSEKFNAYSEIYIACSEIFKYFPENPEKISSKMAIDTTDNETKRKIYRKTDLTMTM